ncbi:DNA replication factor Cdt1 C-terminal domain-containing protein [Aspergillus clavatus NRRL 1]|uniref:DNA replication factor Cdt1 C-terminal domain-containing protein n=1 Tax=Aspergillus clavatus (strain ATCC 1007 / CBS 513.65 / DSM 816 / NCTC 3887 / NRRL 1 / QM 1276 / 107) TaxID=344612 RepID=A1CK84_ASPCL|nr:uncharacterized protein ACLA_037650 [Aspergillus clavatus NRRL 1]EAW09558.1 conserved hypothetical protein [Aspergillus clavatus NRRL 1]
MPRTSSRQTCLPRGQVGIQSFARATKSISTLHNPAVAETKKLAATAAVAVVTAPTALPVSPSKKRKLNELENVDCGHRGKTQSIPEEKETAATPSKTLRFSQLCVSTPRSGHYASSKPDPSSSGVGVGAREKLVPASPTKRGGAAVRKAKRCSEPVVVVADRPACVEEVLGLHSAFLRALSIHSAHNGTNTPADLREFLRSMERVWKKRKVVVKDLQRLLWVCEQASESTGPRYRLANYGLGKVCLERVACEGSWMEEFDEKEAQERMEQTLDLLWEKALDAVGGDESRVEFFETLGVSPVHESLTPFTAFRKGQQRLQDLRGGVIKVKTEKLRADVQDDAPAKPLDATTTRRKGLLERIKSKELLQSKLPPPPSKDMLLRRAAAERVEEVVAVLALLRPVGYVGSGPKTVLAAQRKPFQMKMVVQNVQDSLRNPISAKEVEICLELLARPDVAGQWIEVVAVNQAKSVVLKSCATVHPKEIGSKVCQLKLD